MGESYHVRYKGENEYLFFTPVGAWVVIFTPLTGEWEGLHETTNLMCGGGHLRFLGKVRHPTMPGDLGLIVSCITEDGISQKENEEKE